VIALLTDAVLIITGFLLVLLSVVVLTKHKGSQMNRFLLAGFLLVKALLIVRWSLFTFDIIQFENSRFFYYLSAAFFFLLAPLLYLYVKSICYNGFRLKTVFLLHIIPFFLVLFITDIILLLENTKTNVPAFLEFISEHYWQVFWSFNFLQILVYILAIFINIWNYHIQIKEQFSSINKIKLDWLYGLLILISLHWIFVVSRGIISLTSLNIKNFSQLIDLFSISIFLVFVTMLVVKGLGHINVFNGIEAKQNNQPKLSNLEARAVFQIINEYMQEHKPYLLPSLSLSDLSAKLDLPSWQISFAINHSANLNFFNFINSFRIKEAQKRLKETTDRKETILEILYDVGFNSKSTFNDVFRKFTGKTPTEYRKAF